MFFKTNKFLKQELSAKCQKKFFGCNFTETTAKTSESKLFVVLISFKVKLFYFATFEKYSPLFFTSL